MKNKPLPTDYVIRVFQGYSGDIPTLKSATGSLKLPFGEIFHSMNSREALPLELQDGRIANIIITNSNGSFQVTGPIAAPGSAS